jgi:hypothetical protein
MRRHPRRTFVDPMRPKAWGTDDRSGFIGNHQDLCWQHEWAGQKLINLKILTFPDHLDKPQRQLGTIVLSPDPMPVMNARPEQYYIDEQPVSTRVTMDGRIRCVTYMPYPVERIVSVQGNIRNP